MPERGAELIMMIPECPKLIQQIMQLSLDRKMETNLT